MKGWGNGFPFLARTLCADAAWRSGRLSTMVDPIFSLVRGNDESPVRGNWVPIYLIVDQ
jgi:hypothetical protein